MTSLGIIAGDKQLIPYRKELNTITGGVTSTILLQQLIYWWKKAGNKPFFKFMSPCGHDKYKAGDSWTEELGFSVKEFRTALRRLEDSGLVTKRTGADRVTWYTLNSELVEEQIKGQYVNAERAMVNAERAVPLNAERAIHTTNSRLPETTTEIPPNPQRGNAGKPQNNTRRTFGIRDLLANNPNGVCEHVLADWLAGRNKQRAPVTATAWSRVNRELAKCAAAGIRPDDALAEAMEAGWKGLKAEWIQNRLNSNNNTRHSTTGSYDCPKCGNHANDCACWADDLRLN